MGEKELEPASPGPSGLIAPGYFPGRDFEERPDALYFKTRPKIRWTAKLKNRRIIMAHDGDLWAVWFKTLVNRKERKISTLDFCMTEEAMDAFLGLHMRIRLDERQQARSARPSEGGSNPPSPKTEGEGTTPSPAPTTPKGEA